jgi:methylated-DNA-protein-cysteine methyltransferase-like protein
MASAFYQQVWAIVELIPKGKVTTYGAIAKALGSPGASRTVGYAMNACDKSLPAHRVVNRKGWLTGKVHFNPPSSMAERLESEGIVVIKDEIQHFENHFWDPTLAWQSI